MRSSAIWLLLGGSLLVTELGAQSPKDRAENLATCLSGQFPILCRHEWLSAEDLARAREAERLQNLETCLTGLYPTLCKRNLLAADEKVRVDAAERRENLKTCLAGTFPTLCKHGLLSPAERVRVIEAERVANLHTCLAGKFPALCDHSKLSAEELSRVRQAEQTAAAAKKSERSKPRPSPRATRACEDGHWIDSVSDDGEVMILEDGTVWEVDSLDTITSALWLPMSSILACDGRLINTDDDEMVSAEQISGGSPSAGSGSGRRHEVQASVDDETFVINGEIFKAKTYCFGIMKGDEIIFVDGNANGACSSASFVVLRNSRKCEVWCE